MWVPTFLLQPAGTRAGRDAIGVALLMAVFVWPVAVASGLLVGRTNDERRRLRWMAGLGLLAAISGWLLVSVAGSAFTCHGRVVAPSACAGSLAARIAAVAAAEIAVVGQWILARREWYYGPGRRWPA